MNTPLTATYKKEQRGGRDDAKSCVATDEIQVLSRNHLLHFC
jgi:hypothetical protein